MLLIDAGVAPRIALGNVRGTNLYDHLGGFNRVPDRDHVVYALILLVLLLVPPLIDTADGQIP